MRGTPRLRQMKGKRKKMRKAIRSAMCDRRPWLEVVEGLQAKGIPLNLILAEANAFGVEKQSSPTASDLPRGSHVASPPGCPRTSAPESTGSPTGRGGVGDSILKQNEKGMARRPNDGGQPESQHDPKP